MNAWHKAGDFLSTGFSSGLSNGRPKRLRAWGLGLVSGLSLLAQTSLASPVPPAQLPAQLEAERECLVRAAFAHPADLVHVQNLALEVLDENPVQEPTLHIQCSKLDEIKAIATSYEVIEEDLQAAFARERARIDAVNATRNVITAPKTRYQEYLNLEQMNEVVQSWLEEFPEYVTVEEIGRSVQDRPIHVVNISRFRGEKAPKSRVVILNGHHAREWLASASTMCFTERLLRGIDKDPAVKKLMSYMTYSLIVMGNPDGYVMTHNGKRMQRKNAHEVDLNRNWDIAWGTVSSSNKKAEDFHGSGPFSEPETTAYSKFISKHGEEIVGFVDIHAFLSAIMAPYGYIRKKHPREEEFAELMKKMANAMTEPGMIKYKTGPIHSTVYQSSGCSEDWVDDNYPESWSLAIEVRGKRFDEPPNQIEPTCNEIEAALMVYLNEIVPMDGPLPEEDEDDKDKDKSDEKSKDEDKSDKSKDKDDDDDDASKGSDDEDKDDDASKGSDDGDDAGSSKDGEKGSGKKDGEGEGDDKDKGGCRVSGGVQPGLGMSALALLALVRRRRRENAR